MLKIEIQRMKIKKNTSYQLKNNKEIGNVLTYFRLGWRFKCQKYFLQLRENLTLYSKVNIQYAIHFQTHEDIENYFTPQKLKEKKGDLVLKLALDSAESTWPIKNEFVKVE